MTVIVGVGVLEEETVIITIHTLSITTIRAQTVNAAVTVAAAIAVVPVFAVKYVMTAVPVSTSDVVLFAKSRCTASTVLETAVSVPIPIISWAITTEIVANVVVPAV